MTQTSQFLNPFAFSSTTNLSLTTPDLFSVKQSNFDSSTIHLPILSEKVDLGPIWTEDELKIFLKYFRQSGLKEIESMQAELLEAGFKRTVNNLLGVYLKNRNFLNYNPSCTAKDLFAIMADRYQTSEETAPIFPEVPPLRKMKSATSEKQDVMSYSSKDMDSLDSSNQHQENLRIKPEEGLTLRKKSISLKRSGYPVDESLFNQSYKPKRIHTSSNIITKEKSKKQRKSTATRGKFPINYNLNDPDLFKNIEIGCRSCGGKSAKKSYHYLAALNAKNNKDITMPFLRFIDCDMAYSPIDGPYFKQNDFQQLLKDMNGDRKLTRNEWSILRSCMGKPRRFSSKFISEQREQLQHYRKMVRAYLYDRVPLSENKLPPSVIQKVKVLQPLQVSQMVLGYELLKAIHPQCQHIHPGSILTITGSSVIIKFLPTELGAMSVPDSKILPVSHEEASHVAKQFERSTTGSLTSIPMHRSSSEIDGDCSPLEKKVVEDVDFNAISMIIKMLEKKTALVSELRHFNNMAETEPENLNEKLKQEFGWTEVQTKLLDNALKHIVTKSRLRGAHNYDTEMLAENFENLLRNPMRNMIESGKRRKDDDKETMVIQEIKGLLNKSIEEKISVQIKGLTEKFGEVSLNSQPEARITRRSMDETEDKNEKEFEEKNRGQDISTCERSEDKDMQEAVEKSGEVEDEKDHLKNRLIDDASVGPKKEKLKTLVNNMMGVLFSLKYQGDLNMSENKYLTELHTEIYEENADEFHEINTVLLNICSR